MLFIAHPSSAAADASYTPWQTIVTSSSDEKLEVSVHFACISI